ncbi:MAG: biopolymer transporter ExbD [Holophagales bacterium]|nr:biopolymer transporter ExbD [Holophagales bacterium]
MKLRQHRPDDDIPTSSMADIAFLLIVYFMVTTTFAATRGLDFSLPKDDDTPPIVEKQESVLVEILPSGDLLVDQKPMESAEIIEYLEPKLERDFKKPVIIKPDSQAPYGKMVEVFDVLRRAKIIDGKLVRREDQPGITDEIWDEGKDINISIPTRREIESFWF